MRVVFLASSMLPLPSITIPPELFPLIASFIPLRSAPNTLLSLALGNRRFYDIIHPILYSRLILRNEDEAIMVFQKIMREPRLGLAVTELYVMSELSLATRQGKKPFDAVSGLQMLVQKQLLPRVFALGIYLVDGWDLNEPHNSLTSHGRLLLDFWRSLGRECPRLRALTLRNVGSFDDDWLSGPVIDEINGISELSALRLEWITECVSPEDHIKILKNLPHLASSLHTLTLNCDYDNANLILSVNFPSLKWLSLECVSSENETSEVMTFFRRHPQLESLSLVDCMHAWFSNDIEVGFLPNLKHLKARFEDIRILVPILPQLVSLAFVKSYNAQVPYLLRAILTNGLPQLRSLEIEQTSADWDDRKMEGVLWYETSDGSFRTEKRRKKVPQDFMDGYMYSIVRGAPNLEELGLHGMTLGSEHLRTLGLTLSQLIKLERFYYRGFAFNPKHGNAPPPDTHKDRLVDFLSSAEALARVCTHLKSVTSISGRYLPYISAIIERNAVGNVMGVRRTDGVGMLISAHEDDPFPCNT